MMRSLSRNIEVESIFFFFLPWSIYRESTAASKWNCSFERVYNGIIGSLSTLHSVPLHSPLHRRVRCSQASAVPSFFLYRRVDDRKRERVENEKGRWLFDFPSSIFFFLNSNLFLSEFRWRIIVNSTTVDWLCLSSFSSHHQLLLRLMRYIIQNKVFDQW